MQSWMHVVQEDGQNHYRWYVMNRYGELICMARNSFLTENDAIEDLSEFLVLMGRDTAA
jgi:hypothetical protein